MNNAALDSGDSDELQALFDSIVESNKSSVEPPPPAATPAPVPTAAATPAEESAPAKAVFNMSDMGDQASSMFSKIGQLTRHLHDTLRELGYDKSLEEAAAAIPDARDRLNYVATMTEQAAERALNAVDAAMPLQEKIQDRSGELVEKWEKLFNKQLSVEEFKVLAHETRQFLNETNQHSKDTSSQLLEIMMAQDFQDLTGQVIKKIVGMAKDMEQHLLGFLVEFASQNRRADSSLLNGPVVNAEGRADVVTSQEQVDDLLESLGF
ncbi:protein phosphatase CheZ [Chitinivorax sp. B]|uniref:protein phosphatase CheZ n=1 Tax=Chitinivorax sp. B TaxID=2502235 RepID=UPI0010F5A5F6|nr:protein phosphatase CheZ [Chitinivorax sp. B]